MRKCYFIILALLLLSINLFAQKDQKNPPIFAEEVVKPRMRIIIDNDFGGDPDGLFQLVHHLLSPSVEIRAIIGSHLKPGDGFDRSNETATNAKKKIEHMLDLLKLTKSFPVFQGSNVGLE